MYEEIMNQKTVEYDGKKTIVDYPRGMRLTDSRAKLLSETCTGIKDTFKQDVYHIYINPTKDGDGFWAITFKLDLRDIIK